MKTTDKQNLSHTNTLTQLRLSSEKKRQGEAFLPLAGSSMTKGRLMNKNGLKMMNFEPQTKPGSASKNLTLSADANCLKSLLETLGREG